MKTEPACPRPAFLSKGGAARPFAPRAPTAILPVLLCIMASKAASATPRPRTATEPANCVQSAAGRAAILGNWTRAGRLFVTLFTKHRCPAPVWELAAESWIHAEDVPVPPTILKKLGEAALRARPRLSKRIRVLAGRLQARRLLTGRPLRPAGLHGASSDGATGQNIIAPVAPKGRLRVLTRFDAPLWTDPLVGRDPSGRQIVYAASIRGDFAAMAPDGRLVWRRQVHETIVEGLAGAKGIVAGASRRHILLLDALSGRVLARLHRPKDCHRPRRVQGRIEMVCGKTLFAVTRTGLSPLLSQPEDMTAGPVSTTAKCQVLGRSDGTIVLTCEGKPVPETLRICHSPVVGLMGLLNGSIVATCREGELVATTARNILWKVPLPARPTAALGLGSRRIYVGLIGLGLAALSTTGTELDLRPAGATMMAGPVSDSRGGVLVAGRDGRIHRWSERGGTAWTVELGTDIDARPVVLDNGSVVVAATDGRLLIVD